MENSGAVTAIKITLSSSKVVLIREPKIRDQEMSMQIAATRSKDNTILMVTQSQKELLKLILLQIDGKSITKQEVERLDDLFTLAEYNQVMQVVGKVSGGADMGECQIEHEISGDK